MLRIVLEVGVFLPLAAGIFYSRNQDRYNQYNGSFISLHEPNIHGMYWSAVCDCIHSQWLTSLDASIWL